MQVRPAAPDPRVALWKRAVLSDEHRRALPERLDRWDAAREVPRTRPLLRLIAEDPGLRAPDLAASLGRAGGRKTLPFERDVREREELGLTHTSRSGTRSHTAGGPTSAERSGTIEGVNPRTAATAFRIVAVAEALSWLGLLAGMYVKYVPQTSEAGVQVFGPIHGAVFVAYVLVALVASRVLRWDLATTLLALVASVPPLVTVPFERWASRTGRLPAGEIVPA